MKPGPGQQQGPQKFTPKKDPTEFQPDFLGEIPVTIARYAFWGGAGLLVLSIVAIVFLIGNATGEAAKIHQLANTMGLLQKGILIGVVGTVLGSAWLFWEEEIMVGVNLMGSLVLFFSSELVPMAVSIPQGGNEATNAGLEALSLGGKIYLGFALTILIVDIALRVKQRSEQGSKKDSLKYGKGITQESDRKNVFMGKCWQLPYCRKFVREKCPIYHAQRTCWRELVGCMCEESVIRVAMEGKPVSKEALLSGAAIPRNNKLSDSAKRERCRNCVIYNEHQKHKYKLAMPLVVVGYTLIYVLFKGPLANGINNFLESINRGVQTGTGGAIKNVQTGDFFTQFLVGAVVVVMLAYTIKMVEFAIFKLKI